MTKYSLLFFCLLSVSGISGEIITQGVPAVSDLACETPATPDPIIQELLNTVYPHDRFQDYSSVRFAEPLV